MASALSRIRGTEAVPYRWICSIIVELGSVTNRSILPVTHELAGKFVGGTGLLIAGQYVLTCGHILRTSQGDVPKRILVAPARKPAKRIENGAPFGVWVAEQSWVHDNLFSSSLGMAQSFDFGLLKLAVDEKTGERPADRLLRGSNVRLGWWGKTQHDSLKVLPTSFHQGLANRRVNVAGYPEMGKGADGLFHGFNDVLETFPRDQDTRRIKPLITYDVATRQGVSGAPIWTFDRNPVRRRLVAIHSGTYSVSRDSGRRAVGLLIRPSMIQFLLGKGVNRKELRWTGWKP